MTFFYDLNKKLDEIRATPELTHGQLNEGAYQGGPDKSQIPAAQRKSKDSIPFYKDSSNNPAVVAQGSNWKMTTKDLEKERTQSPTSAEGMRALQDRLSKINPMDEADMEEGNRFIKAVVDAKADGIQPGEKINVGGKEYPVKEAAKWRDPKFKDKLYTQEPRDYDQYDYGDDDYYNPKPADYPGEKNLKGGSEFDHNDPLQKGQGIGRSGIKNNILDRGPRKGLPSRDQITSLKGSIKSASGTHARPNLPEASTKKTVMPQTGKKPNTNESIKLIAVKEGAGQTVKVYCDTAYDEFHVRVFSKGQEIVESRYFTQSQDDAITTADYMVEGAFTMAPKQKFADKIADAKQEVDEMLGDVAAEAMKSAIGKMKMTDEGNDFTIARLAAIKANKPTFKVGGKTYRVTGDTSDERAMVEADKEDNSPFTAHKRPRVEQPKRGSVEQGSKHDITHDTTDPKYSGRIAIRRVDPNTGHSVGTDDDTASGDKPKRKAGRPDGQGPGKRIGAKGPSGKSKLMTREGPDDLADQGEYDQEGDMAKDDIKTIVRHAQALSKVLGDNDNLPEWVQSKLAKIEGMMISIDEYMQNQEGDNSEEEPIAEKAVSKQQQKFMGMAHAMQKGETIKGASKELKKVAKTMKPKDTKDFAKTTHKGLPNKVKKESTDKKEEVDETIVAGSVAPAMGGKAPKGKGGMTFGKGVYESTIAESFNSKLKTVLNEGMSVNMSADQDGKKSLTVTATDDDAVKLSQLLNLAGIGGQSQGYDSVCPGCGSSDCGCDQMQEDLANSADNTEYADTNYMVNGLSGGLDGQKTDQSTLGTVINQDPRRTIGSVAESNDVVELYKRIA